MDATQEMIHSRFGEPANLGDHPNQAWQWAEEIRAEARILARKISDLVSDDDAKARALVALEDCMAALNKVLPFPDPVES